MRAVEFTAGSGVALAAAGEELSRDELSRDELSAAFRAAAKVSDAASRNPLRRPLFALSLGQFLFLAGRDIYDSDLRGRAQMARIGDADHIFKTGLIKNDLLSIRRPTGTAGVGIGVGRAPEAGPIGMHYVDLGLLDRLETVRAPPIRRIAVGGDGDPLPVWRPCRPKMISRVVRDVVKLSGWEI